MADPKTQKRSMQGRLQRPSKKQRRLEAYHSGSEEEGQAGENFDAVDLLDSDEDIHNAKVDDGSEVSDPGSGESSDSDEGVALLKRLASSTPKKADKAPRTKPAEATSDEEDDEDDEDSNDAGSDTAGKKSKSKRNDPNAFATSLSKILSTKLSTSKRADPVLARSAAAHEASKAAVDLTLESKARRQMKEHKRQAMEKGRVKDVLIATSNTATGEPETPTAEILETERRLRKVAQRGVVKLFNAVRTAQVKASEAEKSNRKDGVIGVSRREEKVNELSKKGFLELIASGGGGLKKGALEEA